EAEIKGAREQLGWSAPAFEIPPDVRSLWRAAGQRSAALHRAWNERLAALPTARRGEFERRIGGKVDDEKLTAAVRAVKEKLAAAPKEMATRAASEFALEALVPALPDLIGGSAALTGSYTPKPQGVTVLPAEGQGGPFI